MPHRRSFFLMVLPPFVVIAAVCPPLAAHEWEPAPAFPTGGAARAYAAGLNDSGALLAIGGTPLGTSGDKDTPVQYLPPDGDSWIAAPYAEGNVIRPGAGVDGLGRIIVFGGVDGLDPEGDPGAAYVYDIVEGQYQNIASRSAAAPDDHFAYATDDQGRIYSLGGGPGAAASAASPNSTYAERYEAESDSWSPIAPLPFAVADAAAVYDGNGHILVLGGLDATGSARHTAVQQYTIANDTWSTTAVAAMPVALSAPGAVRGADDRIYVVGGISGPTEAGMTTAAVHALDLNTNVWSAAPDMQTPRSSFATALGDDDFIYAMGGDNDSGGTDLVERLYTPPCPTIIRQPSAVSGWVGQKAVFNVVATGGGSLNYVWRKDGVALADGVQATGSTVSGAATSNLLVSSPTTDDAGQYDVIVTNACGATNSDSVPFDVRTPPDLSGRWYAFNIHPAWSLRSTAVDVSSNGIVGTGGRNVGDYSNLDQPLLWTAPRGDAAINLTPAGSVGGAINAIGGDYQVGWWWWPYQCHVGGQWQTCYTRQACMWSGDVNSHENLQVSGMEYSACSDTDGVTHVGTASTDDASGNYSSRATKWTPPGYYGISLHPAEASNSSLAAIADGRFFGIIYTPYPGPRAHAAMWTNNAASFVDMNPEGANSSTISGAGDGQVVGTVGNGAGSATLWSYAPGTDQPLHPDGAASSSVSACDGGVQVGRVSWTGPIHAAAWTGVPESVQDLHVWLPSAFTSSHAAGIDVDDDGAVWIVGSGYNSITGRQEALLWLRPATTATPGDIDADGDVDLGDYGMFADCLSGPGNTSPPMNCAVASFVRCDLDSDGDADLADAAQMIALLVAK